MNSQSLSLWPMSRTASEPTEVFVVEDIDEVFVNAWLLPNEFESLRASRLKRLGAAAPRLAPPERAGARTDCIASLSAMDLNLAMYAVIGQIFVASTARLVLTTAQIFATFAQIMVDWTEPLKTFYALLLNFPSRWTWCVLAASSTPTRP